MSKVTCPACGSDELTKTTEKRLAHLTLGGTFDVEEENYKCSICGEEGDFALKNDAAFVAAEKNAEARVIPRMLEELSTQKISMARFERAFELPQRTLNRWKAGDFSATSMALMRVVSTCPWLVDVAEQKFDRMFLNRTIVREGMLIFQQVVEQNAPLQVFCTFDHNEKYTTLGLHMQGSGRVNTFSYGGSQEAVLAGG